MTRIVNKFAALVGSVAGSVYKGFTGSAGTAGPPQRRQPQQANPATSQQSGPDVMGWARRQVEKIRAGVAGGRVRFLTPLDCHTGETPEIRGKYREMLREPTLKAALATKVLAVAAQEPQSNPGEDADDPRQKETAEFGLYALRKLKGGPRRLAWNVLWHGCMEGNSVCEKVWDIEAVKWGRWHGKRLWRAVKAKADMVPQVDDFLNITGYRGGRGNGQTVYPPSDFVTFTHMPMFEAPGGMSDFRAPYRAFVMKDAVMQLWGLNLDKFAGPYFIGRYTEEEKKTALEDALEEARAHTWLTIPVGMAVDVINFATATGDFSVAIDRFDREMLIGTVGAYLHILEGQVSDGRGDTGIAKETSELFQDMLLFAMGDVVSECMMPELTEINFAAVPSPVITWGTISEKALLQRANVDDVLMNKLKMELSASEAYKYFNRQRPANRDDVLGAMRTAESAGAVTPSSTV